MVNGVVPIHGAKPEYQRRIREVLNSLPPWFVRAARVNSVVVTNDPRVREQVAQYEHGSRRLYVAPGVGQMLTKAVVHELSHGVDDNFDHPHFFTSTEQWRQVHSKRGQFDLLKYELEPLEHFADSMAKFLLVGSEKLRITHPDETGYFEGFVIPVLQKTFGGTP